MTRYDASFEIDSKADSYAARRVLERVYDTVREEVRTVGDGSGDSTEVVRAFKALRDAAEDPTPGTLTITYEQYDAEFGTSEPSE